MKIQISFLITLLTCGMVLASSESHGAHEEIHIPLTEIGWQAANLGLLLIALIFFLRKSMQESFQKRQSDFIENSEKTKAALQKAENDLTEIKTKLSQLENGEMTAIEKAKKDAANIKSKAIGEADTQVAKLFNEADQTIILQLNKVKEEIAELILNKALAISTEKISNQSSQVNNKVETNFIDQIEKSNTGKAGL